MRIQQSNQKLTFMRCQRYPANIEEEQNYSMSIIEKQIQSAQQEGPRKLVFKLYSYLIFYHSIECDAFVPEPVLGGVVLKKVESGELKMPIRCVFCRLVRIKSFVEFYFRFELTTRFGKLCLFRLNDSETGNVVDLYAHEMCLLWSAYVGVDHETRRVDTNSVMQAAAYAQQLQCNYCQLAGASTKCFDEECPVAFHFNCLKQMKLVGIKLDPINRFIIIFFKLGTGITVSNMLHSKLSMIVLSGSCRDLRYRMYWVTYINQIEDQNQRNHHFRSFVRNEYYNNMI